MANELVTKQSNNNMELKAVNEQLRFELDKREQVEAELKTRIRQQAAVAELGQRALVGTTLPILLNEAVAVIRQGLQVECCKILELDSTGELLLLKAGAGWQDGLIGQATLKVTDGSQAGYALLIDGPVLTEDLSTETRFLPSALLQDHQISSAMSVIIKGRERSLGVLGACTSSHRTFTEDDVHFLQAVANVLAMAIERRQAETEIIQLNRELLSLQSAGVAISSSLELKYVLETVTREMASLLGVETCAIADWNRSGDTTSVLARYGSVPETGLDTYPLSQFPVMRRVLLQRQPIQMTLSQTDLPPADQSHLEAYDLKTQLLLPIIFQGQVIGLVDIMDSQVERHFSEQEISLATMLANQAASAIENARLHAETRRLLKEQMALREAGAVISSSIERQTVLSRLAEQMARVLEVSSSYIGDYDPQTETLTGLAEYFRPAVPEREQVSDLGTTYHLPADFPGIFEAWQTGQPGIAHADDPNLSEPERTHLQRLGAQTILAMPLYIGRQLIGYVELRESQRQREFTVEEIALCQDLAQQAAIAIENARLFEQTQFALEETAILYRVTSTLASLDNEQAMYELVLTEYVNKLGLSQGGVLLLENDKISGTFKARLVAGQLVKPGATLVVSGNPAFDQLIENKEPVAISDVQQDSLLEPVRQAMLTQGLLSVLLVPIIVRTEVIGVLLAEATHTPHHFSKREVTLVKAMADQLGIAVENIRLHAETERRARQLAVLHELDRAITSSLRVSDVCFAFARHATRLLPHDHMFITLAEEDHLRVTYLADPDQSESGLAVGTILPRRNSAAGWVINQGQLLLRHNIAADPRFVEDKQLISQGIAASLVLSLRVKSHMIGTWHISSRQIGAYTPDDLEIAQAMADQLAIALDNSRLYSEINQYYEEVTTLNTISQVINSTLDLEEILAVITQHTRRLANVAAASVLLYDETNHKLRFAAATGSNSDLIRNKTLEPGQGIAGWVFQHDRPVMVTNVAEDDRFYSLFDQNSNFIIESMLCVPLQTGAQIIGALEAVNKQKGEFTQDDLRLLTSLASSAATAIENARHYQQVQQEVAERRRAEAALEEERAQLAQRVAEQTADLRAANAELAQAARLKDEFLANMSHELRTPLTAVLGLSEILMMGAYGKLSDTQHNAVRNIEISGRHLLNLINDILDLSKVVAGQLELQLQPVLVENICKSCLQFIDQTAQKKNLKILLTVDNEITILEADELRLKQILVNLLSNAVKFTPEDGEIGLEVVGDPAGKQIHFTVWDTGIGMASEHLDTLFQPFIQLDSGLSREHSGTGLGLALVYQMVKLHGGQVSVESEPGKGSRFTVSLPWSGAFQTETLELIQKRSATTYFTPIQTGQAPAPELSPLILVVEDEKYLAKLMVDYLKTQNYRTHLARSGVEALAKAREEKPDLILMDIQMPGMDGLEVTRRIRADADLNQTPIIAVTALAMAGDRERCLDAGANDYLSKPIKLDQLLAAIQIQLKTVNDNHN